MLRRAACRYARPTGPVPAELFAAAVYRARWLVVVDGLDEIQQDDARQELITLLAAQGRGQSGHRLVVLARPLAPSELRPLIDAGFLPFSLPRFTRDELHEFGRRRTGGEVFERIEDPYLIEMLKVPLFAELALSVAARGDGPVPANRLDLIEAFLAGLRSASSRSALLSPAQSDDLLAELAVSTVSTVGAGGSLLGPAAQWCRARGIGLSPEEIRHHLIRTGVLVAAGDELVFAHHALAEYLAARRRSAALPSGDSAVLELVGELRARSRTNLVTYTVILHLRRHPVLVVRVIRALLAEDTATAKNRFRGPSEQARGGVLAAAELILDGVAVDDPIRNWVINRLVAHAVGKDDEDSGESVDVLDVLARFGSYPELGQRLREIVTSGNADVRARCRAATHLALGGDRATAESELEGLLPNAGSAANALTIIDTLAGLRDGTGDLARESLERWGDDPATEPWTLVSVAERLADLGDREKAAELGRRAFAADRGDSGGHVGRAAELLLALDPAAADQLFEAFRSSGRRNPFEQAELALAFAEAGAVGPAVALAREALADPQLSSFDEALQWAVDAWFFSAEPTEAELVGLLRALPSRARRETLQALPREHAAYGWRHRLLSELLDEPDHSGLDLVDAVRIARDPLSPESTTALLRPVTRPPRRGARALAKVGAFPPGRSRSCRGSSRAPGPGERPGDPGPRGDDGHTRAGGRGPGMVNPGRRGFPEPPDRGGRRSRPGRPTARRGRRHRDRAGAGLARAGGPARVPGRSPERVHAGRGALSALRDGGRGRGGAEQSVAGSGRVPPGGDLPAGPGPRSRCRAAARQGAGRPRGRAEDPAGGAREPHPGGCRTGADRVGGQAARRPLGGGADPAAADARVARRRVRAPRPGLSAPD